MLSLLNVDGITIDGQGYIPNSLWLYKQNVKVATITPEGYSHRILISVVDLLIRMVLTLVLTSHYEVELP